MHMHTLTHTTCTRTHAHTHTHSHTHTHTHTHMHMHTHTHNMHTYMCTHTHTHTCMHAYAYIPASRSMRTSCAVRRERSRRKSAPDPMVVTALTAWSLGSRSPKISNRPAAAAKIARVPKMKMRRGSLWLRLLYRSLASRRKDLRQRSSRLDMFLGMIEQAVLMQ
jgi:hypothetical protein